MSQEYFNHRIADASKETLNLVSYIDDLKTERGVTSSEAMELISRYREIEKIRLETEKLGGSSLQEYSAAFIETFDSKMPVALRSLLSFGIAQKSTVNDWGIARIHYGALKEDAWFSLHFSETDNSPLCSVEGCFTREEALLKLCDALDTWHQLSGEDRGGFLKEIHESGAEEIIPFMRMVLAELSFKIHDPRSGSETVRFGEVVDALLPHLACRPTKAEVLESMQALELDLVKTEKAAFRSLQACHLEMAVPYLQLTMLELATTLLRSPALTLKVGAHVLFERFKNAMVEKTVWAERRVAMAIMDPEVVPGYTPEIVGEIITNRIEEYRERANSIRNNHRVLGEAQSEGLLRPDEAEKLKSGAVARLEYSNYAVLILMKNRKFLTDYYSS